MVVTGVLVRGVMVVTGVTGIMGLSQVVNSDNAPVLVGCTGSITSVILSIDEVASRLPLVVGVGCSRNWLWQEGGSVGVQFSLVVGVRCSRSRTGRLEGSVLVGVDCNGVVGLVGKRHSLTLLVGRG